MHLFYDPSLSRAQEFHTLSEEESKHACRVLRLREGNEILLLNGTGVEFTAKITDANPKKCVVEIVSQIEVDEPSYSIHIAIAPTKNNDRLEWFLEKATEIGITEITLLLCSNNERKQIKEERFEKILISAMKQSKRLFLPKLNTLVSFKEFIDKNPNGLIAHCYTAEKQTIETGFSSINCPVLIGPEGDFTEQEVNLALQNGYKTITLGENRLRTETAGLYACMQAKLLVDKQKI
jgi:16S rRNA (uracil1498-N3)-methyltransferase